VADAEGGFEWAAPGPELHAFVNELERPIGTYLYGRRMYEVMSPWETMDDDAPEMRDFTQIWRAADKVVYSRTLAEPTTARTRLEREFDPEAVLRIKEEADKDISVGGPELAGEALRAGLVDELHLFVTPVVVGGGNRWLPDDVRIDLELLDERRFSNGVVHLHHGVDLGRSRSSLG